MKMFDFPIAGANYAADTRNYPWHRPPDIVNYDEGVDYLIRKMNLELGTDLKIPNDDSYGQQIVL